MLVLADAPMHYIVNIAVQALHAENVFSTWFDGGFFVGSIKYDIFF